LHPEQKSRIVSYKSNSKAQEKVIVDLKSISFKFGVLRFICMLAFLFSLYFFVTTSYLGFVGVTLFGAALFFYAVVKQTDVDAKIEYSQHLISIYENEVECITNFKNQYDAGRKYIVNDHPYSIDLDIFGPHSIYAIINRTKTIIGSDLLANFLSKHPDKKTIDKRNEAVLEIEHKLDWINGYLAKLLPFEGDEITSLTKNVKASLDIDFDFNNNKMIIAYQRLQPVIWIMLFILYFLNVPRIGDISIVLFIINLGLIGRNVKSVNRIQSKLSKTAKQLRSIKNGVDQILPEEWKSEEIIKDVKPLLNNSNNDAESIIRLNRIIEKLDSRLNLFAGPLLNGFLLWDIKVIDQLKHWKEGYESDVYQLISLVGKMEALASLANWGYNHPHYTYAQLNEDHLNIKAKDVYHPLIPFDENVPNDFNISKGEFISIITGSNMSGKSTFLRTIGINLILAFSGAKVAASSFQASILKVFTYMRIKDALEENVSTFKAELNRVELILKMLEQKEHAIYLIDEMLRGTNSYDKLNGSIAITKEILHKEGYAMIATHDIKLAELANSIERGIENYYFDIEFKGDELAFDYKVKEGICNSFNASFLLRQLGLKIE
jgi:DNA mismatch repair ATPase MutS